MATLSLVRHTLLTAGLAGILSCAHAQPPPSELVDARAAYQRAIQGPALRTDAVRLGLAKHALDQAELAYAQRAPTADVRDRAYVSLRFTQTAEAEAAVRMLDTRQRQAMTQLAAAEAQQRAAEQAREAQARAAAANTAQAVTLPGKVLFGVDEDTLKPDAKRVLDAEAQKLKARPPSAEPVVIEGHTDSTGDPAYNQDLSERRAEAVRDYLLSHGVDGEKVTVQAEGPHHPVSDNDSAEGRAENRRVEIQLPEAAGGAARPVTTPLPSEMPSP